MTLADLWQNPRVATISPSPQGNHVNSRTAAQLAMFERTNKALDELMEVCRRSDRSHYDVQSRVEALIASLVPDADFRGNVGVPTGEIDLLVNNNVIVEIKVEADDLGVAPMWARQDQTSRRKFAASQLQDYVNARYEGVESSGSSFFGYTTNGLVWHKYSVAVGAAVPEKIGEWAVERESEADALFDDLVKEVMTRPIPPADLSELLAKFPRDASTLAKALAGTPEFETKRRVWEDLMRGASVTMPPDDDARIRLFASHSVLVELARGVAQMVTGQSRVQHGSSSETFSDWIAREDQAGGADAPAVRSLRRDIDDEVERFDWRLSGVDDLKGVYHDFIPRSVRHDFGEYYTPDWLADAVCEEVLDDDWCQRSIARAMDPEDDLQGCGLLEPSCGSGTFLRAAVKRLIPFAERATTKEPHQADIVCRLIHGIDLHPVAVELARATVLAALPAAPTDGAAGANVWLADTLRWVEDTEMHLFATDGILVHVPGVADLDSLDLALPAEVVNHVQFSSIVEEVFGFRYGMEFVRDRIDYFDLSREAKEAALELSCQFEKLSHQGRDDVWKWFLLNVARAHILQRRKFDRIIGNPPWITRKDLQGERKAQHREKLRRMKVWAGGANLATQNNLAALFVATVARDFTPDAGDWRSGFVLPYAALRSKVWEPFRTGAWKDAECGNSAASVDLGQVPWDFKELTARPFPQSDSCVIFARAAAPSKSAQPFPAERMIWRGDGVETSMRWRDVDARVTRFVKMPPPITSSPYHGKIRNGANMFPIGLLKVDIDQSEELGQGRKRISTVASSKDRWKGVRITDSVVEEACLQELVVPESLLPFRIWRPAEVAIPPANVMMGSDVESQIARFEYFGKHWFEADRIYRSRKSDASPETLLEMIDHMGKLRSQYARAGEYRVVYPKSGTHMFGAVASASMLIDNSLYYIAVSTEDEAQYLAAMLAAECLQNAYADDLPTDRHYDKYHLEQVPVPEFDAADASHKELATLARKAAAVAQGIDVKGRTDARRAQVRDGLRDSGVIGEIDQVARRLLPEYCDWS